MYHMQHWAEDLEKERTFFKTGFFCNSFLTFPAPCISENCVKKGINLNFHFNVFCGASKVN